MKTGTNGIVFRRVWAMPNSNTFTVKPIMQLVKTYLDKSVCSVDPFARNNRWAHYTNDLNPETDADYHMECEDFLRMLIAKGVKADLVIMDPPYSPRQVKECYDGIGIKMARGDALSAAVKKRRRALINSVVTANATVLSLGWNTNGMGKGWKIDEIMLVAHGSSHNDTICMVESRLTKDTE